MKKLAYKDLKKKLEHKIERCSSRLKKYPEKLNMEHDSCHGGWSKGFWDGKQSAYEEIIDMLKEIYEEKDMEK